MDLEPVLLTTQLSRQPQGPLSYVKEICYTFSCSDLAAMPSDSDVLLSNLHALISLSLLLQIPLSPCVWNRVQFCNKVSFLPLQEFLNQIFFLKKINDIIVQPWCS